MVNNIPFTITDYLNFQESVNIFSSYKNVLVIKAKKIMVVLFVEK